MILRFLSKTRTTESVQPSSSGRTFRADRRGDDVTERLARLTQALRPYGHELPQRYAPGSDEIHWID